MRSLLRGTLAVSLCIPPLAGAVPFFKGFGTDGMQAGEHG